ncbi:hypothetical protein [Parerythrobacter jejuensis]|uniref:DUF541 domain-containing protein n=1 Tax=Parerythrobacter jejuensis TaxID=795812 RepID=A0A845AQA3_9SPHN|nr:hypothetical protein [Parerythrobacter jejuensis]MXP30676.1 hypothetical protein [Parerythrobacter jejuensis]MXP33436.1 hypothetical protein [Parerythrobacter jejuensis]
MTVQRFLLAMGALALTVPVGAQAQDELVVVTGSRSDRASFDEYYNREQAAIGLTRKADYFVKPLYVSSDSRDSSLRVRELRAMLRETISRAAESGISLVAGNYTLTTVTMADVEQLQVTGGRRPDTNRVSIYARIPVDGKTTRVRDADQRIQAFIKAVPATGRSYIETGSTSLALTNPDQYRGDVVRAVANEAKRYAGMFGSDYGISIEGLDSELFWQQSSETEVFLYINHEFVIRPK